MQDVREPSGGGSDGNTIQKLLDGETVSQESFLSALQNVVVAINNLNTTMGNVFPQATAYSTAAATAGAVTFTSSQALGFLSVVTSSGATVKVPVYT